MNRMNRKTLTLVVAATFATLAAMSAFADNVRPVAIGLSSDSSEPTLQSILSGSSGFESVIASTDQSTASEWSLDNLDVPSTINPTMKVEYAGNASTNQLGIWGGSSTYTLFGGAATTGSIASITWLTLTTGHVSTALGSGVIEGDFTGISASQFGFYLDGADGKLYSADSKNGGAALMLAYKGATPNDWMFGFEDTKLGDKDYQDMVFRVSDLVTAVPEPETYAMLLAGLGLMGFIARRRQRNAAA